MRCRKENGPHAWIGHGCLELGRQFKAFGSGKIANEFGLLADAADDPQAVAFALDRLDDIFSPSAKADHGGIDHRRMDGFGSGLAGWKLIGNAY
jgi:hypothetical protein